ncbi:MAG: cell wall-binding repeat-containing protein [Solirubrobacteraceae bacterium]|nr:cell wall-binding repeat-containing protein [Solirubrobacteraceae bacterium]
MSRRFAVLLLAACAALVFSACGRSEDDARLIEPTEVEAPDTRPQDSGADDAPATSGIPSAATKNTTRLPGPDPAALAADAALAVFPSTSRETRPGAVALVDQRDWRTALAASALMGPPLRAPLLLTDPEELPPVTAEALRVLNPSGVQEARGAQLIRVGTTPRPEGLRPTDITASGAAATAAAVDSFLTSTRGTPSRRVLVVSADDPAFAMPAAAWAAKSGDPILFVGRNAVPAPTTSALRARRNPSIFIVGPESAISTQVQDTLEDLGEVTRIQGPDPVRNAIAFARFADGDFGWGVTDPGHGLVFARTDEPLVAAAVSPLSAAGTYGPLLLLDGPGRLGEPIREYLLDIQPGYQEDPVRGVYNHGWIAGDDAAISLAAQGEIDGLLEIVPVREDEAGDGTSTTSTAPAQTTATAPAATTPTQTQTQTQTQLSQTPPTTTTATTP